MHRTQKELLQGGGMKLDIVVLSISSVIFEIWLELLVVLKMPREHVFVVVGKSLMNWPQYWHYVEHLISWKGRFITDVSEAPWFTAVRPGLWKRRTSFDCKGLNTRWCGECAVWLSSKELYNRLEIDIISSSVTRSRLRWYGHVQQRDYMDWLNVALNKRCLAMLAEGEVERPGRNGSRVIRKD